MIKVDFDQLWSEFNNWISYNMIQEHEINKYEQHLNIYGEYGFTNHHSVQMRIQDSDFWLLHDYAIGLMDCQSSKNLV